MRFVWRRSGVCESLPGTRITVGRGALEMHRVNECKVLHVNLTDRSYHIEVFGEEYVEKYLGGRGITSLILYRDVPRGADPYGPDNIVAFAPGTLAGTSVPTAGRTTVTGKSPATGLFMKANMGGNWG